MEISTRPFNIDISDNHGTTVEELDLRHAGESSVRVGTASRTRIVNNTIRLPFVEAIWAGSMAQHDDLLVEANSIFGSGGTGIQVSGRHTGTLIIDNHLTSTTQLHPDLPGASPRHEWSAAIKIWGGAEPGWVGRAVVKGNIVDGATPAFDEGRIAHKRNVGIWIDEAFLPTEILISNNTVHAAASRGIFVEKSDNVHVHHNVVAGSATYPWTAGIQVESNYGVAARRNFVRNNTIVGGYWGLALNTYEGRGLDHNTFANNVVVNPRVHALYAAVGVNDGRTSIGNRFTHNAFGMGRPGMISWLGTSINNYQTWLISANGAASGPFEGDLRLANVAAGDYRPSCGSPLIGTADDGGTVGAMEPAQRCA